MLSLATQTNSVPLPSVPEVYGVRLPPASECLTAVDFDLVPNKPPPGVKLFDEEIEEVEESESDDEDMEPAPLPHVPQQHPQPQPHQNQHQQAHIPPIAPMTAHTPSDVDMLTPGALPAEEGSEAEEDDPLFAGGDEEEEESGDDAMEDVTTSGAGDAANGMKRKLVEEEDYD